MVIYGLKSCDTCRKAVKATGASLRDVRADPLSATEIERLVAQFGDDLVNKRSTTWRGLDETDRAKDVAALLQAHPTAMKRPVIVVEDTLYLGWTGDVRNALGA